MSKEAEFSWLFSKVVDIRSASVLETSSHLLSALKNSAENGKIKVFSSGSHSFFAYLAWAEVNKESLVLMGKTKQMPPFLYEWNEGRLMVIYDVVFLPKWGVLAKREILQFLRQVRVVAFLKRGNLHIWSRRRRGYSRKIL